MPDSRQQLEDEIRQAACTGRKIEAIKLYRQLHGVGLKEAKNAVEAMASGRKPDNRDVDDDTERQIYEALCAGRKVDAIRLWRRTSGEGLKQSKEFIEELERDLHAESPEKFTVAPRRIGCLAVFALAALVATAIVCRAF